MQNTVAIDLLILNIKIVNMHKFYINLKKVTTFKKYVINMAM